MIRRALRAVRDAVPAGATLYRPLRTLRLPARIWRHLHFEGEIEVRIPEGGRFRMRARGEQLENELFWSGLYGEWEGDSLRVWVRLAREARVVLDIGANTGLFALAAAAVEGGRAAERSVHAFEPHPGVHPRLEANARLNGARVVCHPVALSDRDGRAAFFDPGGEHAYAATLAPETFGAEVREAWRAREVPTRRLDALIAEGGCPVPDLIKLDVEGHEPAVLDGMARTLEEAHPTFLMEVLTAELAGAVADRLLPLGYRAQTIGAGGTLREADPRRPPENGRNLLWS